MAPNFLPEWIFFSFFGLFWLLTAIKVSKGLQINLQHFDLNFPEIFEKVLLKNFDRFDFKMKVLVKYQGKDFSVENVSKAMEIKKFRQMASKVVDCEVDLLDLYFGGKKLNNKDDLCAYRIENGNVIMALKRQALSEIQEKNEKIEVKPENPAKDEENVSAEDLKDRLKEIGGEDLLKEIENEIQSTNNEPAEPCKKCKDDAKKKCRECGCQVILIFLN